MYVLLYVHSADLSLSLKWFFFFLVQTKPKAKDADDRYGNDIK